MKKLLSAFLTLLLLVALAMFVLPPDFVAYLSSNFRQNTEAMATTWAPVATASPLPTLTSTPLVQPTELGQLPTEVVPNAQATAGISTIEPTRSLDLDDLPPWGENPDMMKYREALAAASKVNEMSYLVTGSRTACFVGENKERLIGFDFGFPKQISAVFNMAGIRLPDVLSINFDTEVHTSTTICGAALFGVPMKDVVNTSTVTGTGVWESTGTAGKRINPQTGTEELFEIYEQPADFQAQPTMCLIGIHVNGQIINSTYNQPNMVLRAFFPYDMGTQFAIDFERAYQQFTSTEELKIGAEAARESLVSGEAHNAMCAFLSTVGGSVRRLKSCVFDPRIPDTIEYCGDLSIPALGFTPMP